MSTAAYIWLQDNTHRYCVYTHIHFLSRSYQAAVPRIETLFAVPLQSCQLIKRSQLATYVGNGNKIQPQNEIQSRLRIWIRNWNRTRESQCQPWTWTTPHNRWGILGLSVQLSWETSPTNSSRMLNVEVSIQTPSTHVSVSTYRAS